MNNVHIAKSLMKIYERHPQFSEDKVGELSEIFNHKSFLNAPKSKQMEMMLKSSESKYKSEIQYPWDHYFGFSLKPLLEGKTALDYGCFTGGRSIAWYEQYSLNKILGIDINEIYIKASNHFGALREADFDFRLYSGERIPFEDESIDAILVFEVFEHVQDVKKTLDECYRVLKKKGKLFLAFPGYFHPLGHHLSLVTMTPCIHWFFNGGTLLKAYSEILEERGENAYWYKRSSPNLEPWEKCNTINGTTFSKFKKIIESSSWKVYKEIHKPLGAAGRNISQKPLGKIGAKAFLPLTYIPGIQELFLHRVSFILQK